MTGTARIVLGLTMLAILASGLTAAAVLLLGETDGRSDPTAQRIGGENLSFPRALMARGSRDGDWGRDRVELRVRAPDMGPIEGDTLPRDRVIILLGPALTGRDAADAPMDIYMRFVQGGFWTNPGGLLVRSFESDSPYADDELAVAPPDGARFHALCRKAGTRPDLVPPLCLWRYRDGDLVVTVRFDPAWLVRWPEIESGVRALLAAGRAARPRQSSRSVSRIDMVKTYERSPSSSSRWMIPVKSSPT